MEQTRGLRFVASGGLLKRVLREQEMETDEDLALADQGGEGDEVGEQRLFFSWRRRERRYKRDERRGGP